MEATKSYLNEQSIKGYTYSKLAPYFIEKRGMSVLSGECEHILETGEVTESSNLTNMYGEEEL